MGNLGNQVRQDRKVLWDLKDPGDLKDSKDSQVQQGLLGHLVQLDLKVS